MTTKDRLQLVRGKIDKQLGGLLSKFAEEGDKVEGMTVPRRPNAPTISKCHEAYLSAVREQMGVIKNVEGEELVLTKEVRWKHWRGNSGSQNDKGPKKTSRKSYAHAASQGQGTGGGEEISTGGKNVEGKNGEGKYMESTDNPGDQVPRVTDFEERSRKIDRKLEVALEEKMRKTEELINRKKEESSTKMTEMLDGFQEINRSLMCGLIQDQ